MEGQKKGECGHIMASLDPHANCVRCRECNFASAPCAVCLAMTPEQQEVALLAHGRRQHRIQRRKEWAARDRASSVGSSSSKHSSGSVAVGDSLAVDRPTPGSPVAPAKGGGSTAADSAVTNSATPVPSLRRDGGQGPSVTPSTWVDDRGSASLRGQIDGEPASPRARVDGCSADSSPRRVESRGRVRHSRSRTPIERRHRSPSPDRETAEPDLILPYTGLDQDGLDTDRGCWLVPNRERVDRRVRSPSRGVAAGVVRTSAGVQGPVRGPGPAGTVVRGRAGPWSGTRVWPGPWSETRIRPGPWSGTRIRPGPWSGTQEWSGTRSGTQEWSGTRSGTQEWSGTRSEPPGASGLRPRHMLLIGAAHVFVIATPRPRGLRTAMMDGGPSNRKSVAGAAGVPLMRHLQITPWRQCATSCFSRWGLSERTT